jgi:predicted nucleotidyltransferase
MAMPLLDTLVAKRADVLKAASRHGASNVRLFGSVARRSETASSDVDILIDLAGDRGFSDFLALAEELEALIGRKVDLITSRGLSPYLKPLIEEEIVTL